MSTARFCIKHKVTTLLAVIMIATLPVMCIYPFLQKYFMTGLVLGGVKE